MAFRKEGGFGIFQAAARAIGHGSGLEDSQRWRRLKIESVDREIATLLMRIMRCHSQQSPIRARAASKFSASLPDGKILLLGLSLPGCPAVMPDRGVPDGPQPEPSKFGPTRVHNQEAHFHLEIYM